ncbi:hypothetical protein Tco_0151453 [Tanacetum coccineum]
MRQHRWIELLSDYNCVIRYHPGKANVVADALSGKDKEPIQVHALVVTVHNNLPEQIRNAQVEACKEENIGAEGFRGEGKLFKVKSDGTKCLKGRVWLPLFGGLRGLIKSLKLNTAYPPPLDTAYPVPCPIQHIHFNRLCNISQFQVNKARGAQIHWGSLFGKSHNALGYSTFRCYPDLGVLQIGIRAKVIENQLTLDFVILDIAEDDDVPLILRQPFLSTTHAKIDVFKRKVTLKVGEEKLVFKSIKPTTSIIRRVYMVKERTDLDSKTKFVGEAINESFDPLYGFSITDDVDITSGVVLGMQFCKKFMSCQKIMERFAHGDECERMDK